MTAMNATSSWHLYVANLDNTVTVYDPGGTTPVETISQNISGPEKIRFGRTGSVYVLNCGLCSRTGGGSVTVYGAHNHPYLRTISDGLNYPTDIALDSTGNLYVANENADTVTVYPPGGTKVARTITDGISQPNSLAVDSSGRVYVSNFSRTTRGSVTVYDGKTGGLLETIPDLGYVGPIIIGPRGDLYAIVDGNGSSAESYVGVFPWHHVKPTLKISTRGDLATSLAVDPAGATYVTQCNYLCFYSSMYGVGWIQQYGPKGYPIEMFKRKGDIPLALAFGGDGHLYAAYANNEVLGYSPPNKKPFIVITNGVSYPLAVASGP
jgi:hypothetical protein